MRAAGVPVTPGSDGPVSSVEDALAVAETVGYPVLLKASAGGGGRGIRRCDSAQDLPDAYAAAKAEANACFVGVFLCPAQAKADPGAGFCSSSDG